MFTARAYHAVDSCNLHLLFHGPDTNVKPVVRREWARVAGEALGTSALARHDIVVNIRATRSLFDASRSQVIREVKVGYQIKIDRKHSFVLHYDPSRVFHQEVYDDTELQFVRGRVPDRASGDICLVYIACEDQRVVAFILGVSA